MCTCRLSLSYLSWENMQIWSLWFPAFVAPYKRAEFATFLSAGNSRKALLCHLKVTSSEEVQSFCAFVALNKFTTVRCYRRDGAKKRGTMNCVCFRSTCPNNWRIIHCLWNTLILGLWNFVLLKCLVFHAREMCFNWNLIFRHHEDICGG